MTPGEIELDVFGFIDTNPTHYKKQALLILADADKRGVLTERFKSQVRLTAIKHKVEEIRFAPSVYKDDK